jgi:hypothetical protein
MTSSRSLAARCVLRAWSADWAAASLVVDENNAEWAYEEWLDLGSKVGVGMDARKGDGDGDSPQTDKERRRRQKSQRPYRIRASSNEPATDIITWDPGMRWRRTRTRGAERVVLNVPFLVGGGWKADESRLCFCLSWFGGALSHDANHTFRQRQIFPITKYQGPEKGGSGEFTIQSTEPTYHSSYVITVRNRKRHRRKVRLGIKIILVSLYLLSFFFFQGHLYILEIHGQRLFWSNVRQSQKKQNYSALRLHSPSTQKAMNLTVTLAQVFINPSSITISAHAQQCTLPAPANAL